MEQLQPIHKFTQPGEIEPLQKHWKKRNLRIKFQMHLRTLKVHQKNYLKFLLPKGDLLGSEKRYKKARSIRPQKYSGLMSQLISAEASSYEEAASRQVWVDAMIEEYSSIMKNDVWEVVPRPTGKSMVTSRWLYKIKHVVDGSVEKYKSIFVARGFTQKEGIGYDETFAPIARYTTIRTIISLAAVFGWKLHQMDVQMTFLNGKIE